MGLFSGIKAAVSSVTNKISQIPAVSKVLPVLGAGGLAATAQQIIKNVPILNKIQATAGKYNLANLNPLTKPFFNKVILPIAGQTPSGMVSGANTLAQKNQRAIDKGLLDRKARDGPGGIIPGPMPTNTTPPDVTNLNKPGSGGIIDNAIDWVKKNPGKTAAAAGVIAAGAIGYGLYNKYESRNN